MSGLTLSRPAGITQSLPAAVSASSSACVSPSVFSWRHLPAPAECSCLAEDSPVTQT